MIFVKIGLTLSVLSFIYLGCATVTSGEVTLLDRAAAIAFLIGLAITSVASIWEFL